MEKDTLIFWGVIIGVVVLFLSVIISTERDIHRCEKLGGVNVHTYGSDNCWKDGQFININ